MIRRQTKTLRIFDTTLRDGEQAPGNSMTISEKVEIANKLDAMGVDTIEAGYPASSTQDFEAVRKISETVTCKVCAFSRCTQKDIDMGILALQPANQRQIQLLATTSDIHLEHKRGITHEEAISELVHSIDYAKKGGVDDIAVALEDASRANPKFLKVLTKKAVQAGANSILIADTVGCSMPNQIKRLVSESKKGLPKSVTISVHCHNDLGLALANTLAGIEAGADEVQVTLCGIGERAGNAALEEVAAVLYLQSKYYNCTTNLDLTKIYSVTQQLLSIIQHPPLKTKAIIGENAFTTEAGIHQAAMLKNPLTYEFIKPEIFGRTRNYVFGRHSGRSLIRHKLKSLGIQPEAALVDQLYEQLIGNHDSTSFEASLEQLLAVSRN